MPNYHYLCDTCKTEETISEKIGSPREHACKCGGTAKRIIKKVAESTMAVPTPGACAQKHQEGRSANEVMTRIRLKNNLKPHDNPDALAADAHHGRKNKLIPGSNGERIH